MDEPLARRGFRAIETAPGAVMPGKRLPGVAIARDPTSRIGVAGRRCPDTGTMRAVPRLDVASGLAVQRLDAAI